LVKLIGFKDNFAIAEIIEENYNTTNLPVKIYLFQSLPKSDKLELIVQKAVELGVHEIIPVETSRSIVKYDDKKKKAKAQILGNSAHEKKTLPFTKKSGKERNILIFKKIDADIFNSAAAKGKKLGATANDVLVAAYIRSAYKLIGCDKNEKMCISCAVDLRRHMKNPDRIGYTNHTTFMPCTVKGMGDTMADTVKAVAECNRENKKDPFLGLHGLPLLNFAYKAMTYIQAEPTVRLFYANANLALSNVGRVDKKLFSLGGNEPTDAFVAGGAKVKPCAAVNALTLDGRLTLSMTIQGTEEDRKMVEEFLSTFFCTTV
jgi:NRPS condensation-like uncharacterized protein